MPFTRRAPLNPQCHLRIIIDAYPRHRRALQARGRCPRLATTLPRLGQLLKTDDRAHHDVHQALASRHRCALVGPRAEVHGEHRRPERSPAGGRVGDSRRPHHESDGEPRSEGQNRPLYVISFVCVSYPISRLRTPSASGVVATPVTLPLPRRTPQGAPTHRDETEETVVVAMDATWGRQSSVFSSLVALSVSHSQSHFHLYPTQPPTPPHLVFADHSLRKQRTSCRPQTTWRCRS